jgi:hypothetical protein
MRLKNSQEFLTAKAPEAKKGLDAEIFSSIYV